MAVWQAVIPDQNVGLLGLACRGRMTHTEMVLGPEEPAEQILRKDPQHLVHSSPQSGRMGRSRQAARNRHEGRRPMAPYSQLVGIIDLDADPETDVTRDENIGHTLQRLRGTPRQARRPEPAGSTVPSGKPTDDRLASSTTESVVVLRADLRQLHLDLESALVMVLNRLLRHSSVEETG